MSPQQPDRHPPVRVLGANYCKRCFQQTWRDEILCPACVSDLGASEHNGKGSRT